MAGFLNRHKLELRNRVAQPIKDDRVTQNVLKDVREFVKIFGKYLEENHFDDTVVINADETRLTIKGNVFSEDFIESSSKTKATIRSSKGGKSAGLLIFGAASGECKLCDYLPSDFNESDMSTPSFPLYPLQRILRGEWKRFYMFTNTGYLNDESWKYIIEEYVKLTKTLWPKKESLLLLDRLGAHMQPETAIKCLESGVHTIFLPANSSHFVQPLDNNVFTNFKRVLTKLVKEQSSSSKACRCGNCSCTNSRERGLHKTNIGFIIFKYWNLAIQF